MQRYEPPLPRPCRLPEQSVHAVRADPSRINDTAIMHAPQERIMLEDRPLRAFEGRNSSTERAFHGGPGPRVTLRCAVLTHFAMVASGIQPSHSACVRPITGAKGSNTGSSSFPAIISAIVALLPCIRFAATPCGLLLTGTRNLRQPSPPWHRRFAVDFPDPPDTSFGLLQPRPSHRSHPPEVVAPAAAGGASSRMHTDDAALRLQRLPIKAVKLHVPGRLVERKQQFSLPHRKACALLRRSADVLPHDRKLSTGHRGWWLPRARPPLPIHTILPAPRRTARRHAPASPRR